MGMVAKVSDINRAREALRELVAALPRCEQYGCVATATKVFAFPHERDDKYCAAHGPVDAWDLDYADELVAALAVLGC